MNGKPSPLTIIVVEYHSGAHLDDLMNSLSRYEPDAPVLISSNSSYPEDQAREMALRWRGATIIRNEGNLGYAGGVNRALAIVKTPFAAILNPDVTLTEPIAKRAAEIFSRDPKLGLFGPRVLDVSGNPSFSFRRFYPPGFILARYFGLANLSRFSRIPSHYLMKSSDRGAHTYADWVSGGAMFVRMQSVRAVGGMDERYFLYMEDMDWCRSFWRAGWRICYAPDMTVVHRAQHDGTRRGLAGILSLATRRQIAGYFKYIRKWGIQEYCPADKLLGSPTDLHS